MMAGGNCTSILSRLLLAKKARSRHDKNLRKIVQLQRNTKKTHPGLLSMTLMQEFQETVLLLQNFEIGGRFHCSFKISENNPHAVQFRHQRQEGKYLQRTVETTLSHSIPQQMRRKSSKDCGDGPSTANPLQQKHCLLKILNHWHSQKAGM